ncbi:hypothetical protein OAG46_00105 [Planctomycetota bacterium]|nr:hypothetical protein [Planctomycetota bacterium]
MAISVDTVYKTVLLILNKEQRGYMTPDEFNKIGTQVQRELFEKCFEDLNQQVRTPQTDMDYADRVALTDEKIAEFKTENDQTVAEKAIGVTNPTSNVFTVPSELYKLGSVTYEPSSNIYPEMQRLGRSEFYNIRKAPLTTPTKNFPVYLYEDNKCIVYPTDIINVDHIKMQYVKKPTDIRWGYSIGGLGQYVFTNYPYVATAVNIGDITSSITQNPTGFTSTSYSGLTTTVSPTGGSGAILSVAATAAGVSSATITTQGSGYSVNDVLTVPQAQMAGASGDLQITLTEANLFSGSQQGYVDFGLQTSEQTELILNILLYAGIVIRDPQIIQVAQSELQQDKINEKS